MPFLSVPVTESLVNYITELKPLRLWDICVTILNPSVVSVKLFSVTILPDYKVVHLHRGSRITAGFREPFKQLLAGKDNG